MQQVKIWDPVSRLWHWLFAFVVVMNWLLGRFFMTFDTIQWHFYGGFTVLSLLGFRLLWGFLGPEPVRFKSFWPTPAGVCGYLRGFFRREPSGAPGHNPLGALSVYAILLVVAAQALSGLFINAEDLFTPAPLHDNVPEAVTDVMSSVHHTLPLIILILVGLHVAAILFYLFWKRENLITPMIHGRKWIRRE